jgi:hypothetical protein
MPRAGVGLSTPASMTDAILRVDRSHTVWFLLDGRGSFRRKSLFLAEIGALRAFLKSMVQIVVIGDSIPGDLVSGRYSAAARDCTATVPNVRRSERYCRPDADEEQREGADELGCGPPRQTDCRFSH